MALKDVETKPLRAARVRELSTEELKQELARLEEARFRLRFRSATEAIDNPIQFRIIRRNIARIKTVLRERAKAGA
jgi:large subunit ribosomal protein L29